MLAGALLLIGCASPAPVAISCPPPPPVPAILTEPVLTEPSLSARYEALMLEFRNSLTRAIR